MEVNVTIDEATVKRLILEYLEKQFGDYAPDSSALHIEVKSKQNYKSEWEVAAFRAVYSKHE